MIFKLHKKTCIFLTNSLVFTFIKLYYLVMNSGTDIEKLQISRRLQLVLDQLESLAIFDNNSGYNFPQTEESGGKKESPIL